MSTNRVIFGLAAVTLLAGSWWTMAAESGDPNVLLEKCRKWQADGSFREAAEGFRKLALGPFTERGRLEEISAGHIACQEALGNLSVLDEFVDEVLKRHGDNWRALWSVTYTIDRVSGHNGVLRDGEFKRGESDTSGQQLSSRDRDRVRQLQLFAKAEQLAKKDPTTTPGELGGLYVSWAFALRGVDQPLTLTELLKTTDLETLPDYETVSWNRGYGRGWQGRPELEGTPVDETGEPIYLQLPATFAAARNDGERWRWLLNAAQTTSPELADQCDSHWANYLEEAFGLYQTDQFPRPLAGSTQKKDETEAALNVRTLTEEETIARLATGLKRLKLKDEFNPIRVHERIFARGTVQRASYAVSSVRRLADIFLNRLQYPKAADWYEKGITLLNPKDKAGREEIRDFRERIAQIRENWIEFSSLASRPAAQGLPISFRYRNASEVTFTARKIRSEQVIQDVQAYLKSKPKELNYENLDVNNLGYRLVHQNQTQYLEPETLKWTEALKPEAEHLDTYGETKLPTDKPGAYFIEATAPGGHSTRIVGWLLDAGIVTVQTNKGNLFHVADLQTGKPLADAKVQFFGWNIPYSDKPRQQKIVVRELDLTTDKNGQVLVSEADVPPEYRWLIVAKGKNGELATLGFDGFWYRTEVVQQYAEPRAILVTDQPVYRPAQTIKFKAWAQVARYDAPLQAAFAGQNATLEIIDPQGQSAFKQDYKVDGYGGLQGEFPLTAKAALGNYQVNLRFADSTQLAAGTFRVEEYKKPEFEVTVDGPKQPVALGETFSISAKATYYWGGPVSEGKLKYKVLRSTMQQTWYPPSRWDWLYGRGAWWFGTKASWHPGFARWGCLPPNPWWAPHSQSAPEVIIEKEVELGADGTVTIEVDTAAVKALYGDTDHRYEVTVEVVDPSRRMVAGRGEVLIAHKPFSVNLSVNQGYYQTGETIVVSSKSQTIDGQAVGGKGHLKLLRLGYVEQKDAEGRSSRKLVETVVETIETLVSAETGEVEAKFKAAAAGQYRVAHEVTSTTGETIEGGYLFWVNGVKANGKPEDGRDFVFNDLEITLDKATYAPGETARILVQTNRADSYVLLFVRPRESVYATPQVLALAGKTTTVEVPITASDYPNFFVEAVLVADGRVESVMREVLVPPEKQVLDIEVKADAPEYLPGGKVAIDLKVTDIHGQPVVSELVLAVYDRSLDAIAGGSNVGDVQTTFWKWRRSHYSAIRRTFERYEGPIPKQGEVTMQHLGSQRPYRGDLFFATNGVIAYDRTSRLEAPQGMAFGRAKLGMVLSAAPMSEALAAAAPLSDMAADAKSLAGGGGLGGGGGEGETAAPVLRSSFADAAYWSPSIITDADGLARVTFDLPQNIGGWQVRTWGMTPRVQVGQATTTFAARKRIFVRQQAPRFFVEKDEVVLSANVHNEFDTPKTIKVELQLPSPALVATGELTRTVTVAAHSQERVDWPVKAISEGTAVVRMLALGDVESDAIEQTFPVKVHGMLKLEAFTSVLRPEETTGQIKFVVPSDRRPEASQLEVRVSPSLALAMLDALPYLIDYPYGCTEQTINRFMPAILTRNLLLQTGVDLQALKEHQTNLNSQQLEAANIAAARRPPLARLPIFDDIEFEKLTAANLTRLIDMQLTDGGWGWFSGYGEFSSAHTTAVVMHGLLVAEKGGLNIPADVRQRGLDWLTVYEQKQIALLDEGVARSKIKDPDELEKRRAQYRLMADESDALVRSVLAEAGVYQRNMTAYLYRDRVGLSVYGKVLLALSLQASGEAPAELKMVEENIKQFWHTDTENQTGWLRLPAETRWWYWYGNEVEANAVYLKYLAQTAPQSPDAAALVKYLLNNRRNGTYWNSTRDTALCIEGFSAYLAASGELEPQMTIDLLLDDQVVKTFEIDRGNLFTFDNRFSLAGADVKSGPHKLEIRRRGTGPVYWNAYLTNFTLEDPITATGLELKLSRKHFLLEKIDKQQTGVDKLGRPVDQQTEGYRRIPIDGETKVESGDLIEVQLMIESKNDYEYLIFEDFKAAGFEVMDQRSGYTGNELGAFVEFRDDRVAFLTRGIKRGQSQVTYRLRAEIPGLYSALPAVGGAMYSPEIRTNSDEAKLRVIDAK